MVTSSPRIFISYAQEGDERAAWVLALANRLRGDGLDAWIDQYEQFPPHGWRPWMTEQIEQADWVLVVCTQEYQERFDSNVQAYVGRGVRWESQHITQQLYDQKFRNNRFVPVLPPGGEARFIPLALKDYRTFHLDDEYEALYRLLTDQPPTPAPTLGQIRRLPSLSIPQSPVEPQSEPEIPNPYPGLAAFKPEDHRFFFGRDEDTARVVAKLFETRFVSVVGPSGTGKSSLVAAGVVPMLRETESGLTYLRFKPQVNPFRQLAEVLDRVLPEERALLGLPRVDQIEHLLQENAFKAVADYVSEVGQPILLLADQFEELFTQTSPDRAREFRGVFDVLLQVEFLHLVLTLRAEFMHRLMEWLGSDLFATSLLLLDPITREDRLRAIIVRPADEAGVAVQPDLVSTLVGAAGVTKGALPLVALTLQKLFDRRDPEKGLTLDAYRTMGELGSVVETAAAEIDKNIQGNPDLERACGRLFAELATVIDGVPTRRTGEVKPLRVDPHVSELVEALRALGFLTDPDEAHIELAHETLFARWPRLTEWCARYANDLTVRRQAEQAAKDWVNFDYREALRWTWERQEPALEALLALSHLTPVQDCNFTDTGIHAWRALEARLDEQLRSFLHPEPLRLLAELASDDTLHHRREEIGQRLNQMGDPRHGLGLDVNGVPDIAWIDISGKPTPERGARDPYEVKPFRLARYPVTWHQYRAFLDAEDGYRDSAWWEGRRRMDKPGELLWSFDNYPAVNVSWYDALAYCRWLGATLSLDIRLPTEWEWQWAAVADTNQEYPWHGPWCGARANNENSGVLRTVAVGLYPRGRSPFGVDDMTGNVWEWCLNEYDNPENVSLEETDNRVQRGGAWLSSQADCRAAARSGPGWRSRGNPTYRNAGIGFRVCCLSRAISRNGDEERTGTHRMAPEDGPTVVKVPRVHLPTADSQFNGLDIPKQPLPHDVGANSAAKVAAEASDRLDHDLPLGQLTEGLPAQLHDPLVLRQAEGQQTVAVHFEYRTGLRRCFVRAARVGGNWDANGHASEAWTFSPMEEFIADDGCPAFRATVQLDDSLIGQTLRWGVEVGTAADPNHWGIPTEVSEPDSRARERRFTLQEAGQTERYYLTHCRRLGANKLFTDGQDRPTIRFAVWAPNAKDVELVFGSRDSGYIYSNGEGINEELPRVALSRDDDGVWSTDGVREKSLANFAEFEHQPYMFRIIKDDGSVAYRTDPYSRRQIGSGRSNPEEPGTSWSGRREDLDGLKSCSVVIDPEQVVRPFRQIDDEGQPIWPETEWDAEEDFWADEFDPRRPLPTRLQDLVIYELHVDGLGVGRNPRGTLEDAIDLLDHLVVLGINAVELLPWSEFKGWEGWGYRRSHYLAAEYALDGRDQVKHFVRECHRRGIAVIMDVVYNHFTLDSERAEWAYDSDAPERNIYYWYEGQPSDYPAASPPGYGGYVNNISTGHAPRYCEEMVRKLFISSAAQLVTEFHIDGFQVNQTMSLLSYAMLHADRRPVDSVRIFAAKFLREWTRTLRLLKPKVFLIAEDHSGWGTLTQSSEDSGLGFDAVRYADYYHHLIGDAQNDANHARLLKLAGYGDDRSLNMSRFADILAASARRVVYHESHDDAGNSYQEDGENVHSARTLVVAVNGASLTGATRSYAEARTHFASGVTLLGPGVPMFFMGAEVGASLPYRYDDFLEHREDFHALREGDGARLYRFYGDVISLRQRHPALRSDNIEIVYVHDVDRLLVFRRWDGPEEFLVVGSLNNRDFANGYEMHSSLIPDGAWHEVLNSDEEVYGGQGLGNGGTLEVQRGIFKPRIPANSIVVFQR